MRKLQLLRGLIAAAVTFLPASALAQIQLSPVASGLSSPVFVTHAGDSRLFIVEQGGRIKVMAPGATPTVFLDLSSKTRAEGERGLLGLAFHPQYSVSGSSGYGRFFVFYTRAHDDLSLHGDLIVAEYTADPSSNSANAASELILLTIEHSARSNHNGGMLAFGSDGHLYVGVGDGGGSYDPDNNAQNKNSLLGKILRIGIHNTRTAGYFIPPGNPFANIEGADEVFVYGMRNPWRFSFDRMGGQLWIGDVGQGQREEVDTDIVPGGNYGWPLFEGSVCLSSDPNICTDQSYLRPRFDYAHGAGCWSLTGGYVYRGTEGAVLPGTYVYGDYCSGQIFAWNGSTQSILLDTALNISSFGEDQFGELYVVDLNGSVSKIVGSGPPPPPPCTYSITPTRATWAAAGGPGSVTVTTGSTCSWSATPNASWLTVTNGTDRIGSGSLSYTVAPYSAKPKKRNGTITIAGQTFTVQQSR